MPVQIPTHEAVKARCSETMFARSELAFDDNIWVTYGVCVSKAEAAMQRHVRAHADPRIVRIPAVFDVFESPRASDGVRITYIVMEHIKGDDYVDYKRKKAPAPAPPDAAEQALQAIAAAVRHIWELPLPPDTPAGPPMLERLPDDRFFSSSEFVGPGTTEEEEPFKDVAESESRADGRLEESSRRRRQRAAAARVSLQGQPVHICHCNLSEFRIKVGEPVAILDWGYAGVYPRVLEEYALAHQFGLPGTEFAKALHKELFGPDVSQQMRPTSLAARCHAFGC